MYQKIRSVLFASLLVLLFAQAAYPALRTVGPVSPTDPADPNYNGFPMWYRDAKGVALELPNPPAGDGVTAPTMIFDPVDAANPFSSQIGFGTEAFYFLASSTMNLANGGQAILVLGLEAAFASGDAVDKQQIVFARVRIRIDAPVAGDYTVIHPYGQRVFTVTTPGTKAINETIDIGVSPGSFTGALKGKIGPFLKATTMAPGVSPAEWVGDGVTSSTVTGSPTGNNRFRIVGPNGSNIGGVGVNFVETTQFVVSGKIFSGTAFTINRATYSRTASGTTVDVWAHIPLPIDPTISLTATVGGQAPVAMTQSGAFFFAQFPFAAPAFPTNVQVTGTTAGLKPTTLQKPLVDVVDITQATYSLSGQLLTIKATSSDTVGAPVLTARGWGASTALIAGSVTVSLPIPPTSVTVSSSQGGSQSQFVVLVP